MKVVYKSIMIAMLAVMGFNLFGCYILAKQVVNKKLIVPTVKPKNITPRKVETTFALIKPDAVKANNRGKIIDMIERNNFEIVHMCQTRIPAELAKEHYGALKEKPFFAEVIEFITSGPSVIMALKKENAIDDWRKLMGPTDPAKAEQGTIRKRFGTDVLRNAVHGSDSAESASIELARFFPEHYTSKS